MPRTIQTRQERQQSISVVPDYVNRIIRVVKECVRLSSSDNVPPETITYCINKLEAQERSLVRASGSLLPHEDAEALLENVQKLLGEFRKGSKNPNTQTAYTSKRGYSQDGCNRGAPRYQVSKEQLSFLLSCGFSTTKMSQLTGTSKRTISRRMREYGLSIKATYSILGDHELDELVKEAITLNRKLGPNAVKARLYVMGQRVQRIRVRQSMLRVDPGGSAQRTSVPIKRRTYTVAGPNSVWHLDGNHKLIRWKIVIHGGIDGFSRLFVFLQASDNNRKETVLGAFTRATDVYNVPSRICVDSGGENNDVCRVMELLRGEARGSAIRCKSVHNQRIERAWVDTWNGATHLFYGMFQFLEDRGFLDIAKDDHMWALHYIFLPRINAELQLFARQWNNHGLRTEHHASPIQKYVSGALESCHSNLTATRDLFAHDQNRTQEVIFNECGWTDDVLLNSGLAAVEVPSTPCPLTDDALARLKGLINPLAQSADLGMDLYLSTLAFVEDNQHYD